MNQPVAHLLFDAVSRNGGELVWEIYQNDGVTKLAEMPQGVYLRWEDVKEIFSGQHKDESEREV